LDYRLSTSKVTFPTFSSKIVNSPSQLYAKFDVLTLLETSIAMMSSFSRIFFFILLSLFCTRTIRGAEIIVTNLADSGPGSLRSAITSASAGDIISMGVSGTINLSSSIPINNTIEIRGAFPVHSKISMSGIGGNTGALQIIGGTVTVKGFEFINPSMTPDVMAIEVFAGGILRLYNSVVSNATGSGILVSGILEADAVSFIQNSTSSEGGAVFIGSAGGNTSKLINCTFYQNSSSAHGGAVRKNGGGLLVMNCTFFENSAGGVGSEISIFGAGGVTIQNNIFHQTSNGGNAFSNTSAPNWTNGGGNIFSFTLTPFSFIGGAGNTANATAAQIDLGSLRTDGYGMKYMLLNPNSICIDFGNNSSVPSSDTRLAPRSIAYFAATPQVDAGAVEATPYHVTNGASVPTPGSLPQAVADVNSTGRPGPYYIDFDMPSAGSTLSLSSPLTLNRPVIIDAHTQVGSSVYGPGGTLSSLAFPNHGVTLDGSAAGTAIEIPATASGTRISGVRITNSTLGINIQGASNTNISGNIIMLNQTGIKLDGATNFMVGDSGYFRMNCIAGNADAGVFIQGGNSGKVQNNLIGPGVLGNSILGSQITGIEITGGSTGMLIGGSSLQRQGNIIGGNTFSQILISNSSNNHTISGNRIGVTYDSTAMFFTIGEGVAIDGSCSNNIIGGTLPEFGNMIAGQDNGAILLEGSNNQVGFNKIGFSDAGGVINPLANKYGVYLYGPASTGNIIGSPGRNYICASNSTGIYSDSGAGSNTISGNFIGVSPLNTVHANQGPGISITTSPGNNYIGSSNIISGNVGDGIEIVNAGSNNTIINNTIGLDSTLLIDYGNSGDGIHAVNTPGLDIAGNFISGNGDEGIELASDNAFIRNNVIGTNSSYGTPVPNGTHGISVAGSRNKIGISSGTGNYIFYNTMAGVIIGTSTAADSNSVIGNSIHSNGGLGIDLAGNVGVTANDLNDTDSGPNSLLNYPYNIGASQCGSGTNISGNFDGIAGQLYRLDFYQIPSGNQDPSGFGEGDMYLGSISISPSSTGIQYFNYGYASLLPVGDLITVTLSKDLGTSYYETSEFSASVTISGPLSVSVSSTNVSCNGMNDGTVSATISGGSLPYTLQWFDQFSAPVPGATTATVSGLGGGSYFLTVTDFSGCSETSATVVVSEPAAISGSFTMTDILCNGQCNGVLNITASGGIAPLVFSIDNGVTFTGTSSYSTLCPGTYDIVVRDLNFCTAAIGSAIFTNPALLQLFVTPTNETCDSLCDGTLTLSSSGGTGAIQYSVNSGAFSPSSFYGSLCDGSHTVDVMDVNGCTASNVTTISQGEIITAGFSPVTACVNAAVNFTDLSTSNTGTITNWSWNFAGGSPSTSSLQNPVVTFTTSGSQNVTLIASSANCSKAIVIPVNITALPIVNAGIDDGICLTNSYTQNATVSGGQSPYTFTWSPPANFIDNTIEDAVVVSSLAPGAYTHALVATDANGCSASDTMVLNVFNGPTSDAGTAQTICLNSSVTLNGGFSIGVAPITYNWYDNLGTFISSGVTISVTPLASTYYILEVIDATTCSSFDSVNVIVNPLADPTFSYSSNPVCADVVSITPTANTAGGTYTQLSGASLSLNSSTGEILISGATPPATAGNYDIVYNTGGACPDQDTVTVTILPLPDPTFNYSSSSYCPIGTTNPTVTTAGGSFSVNPAGLVLNSTTGVLDLASSTSGSYTVTHTITVSGCTSFTNQVVTITSDDPNIVFNFNVSDTIVYCSASPNQLPSFIATPGGTFSSTNGLPINASTGEISISTMPQGQYLVIYTSPGCSLVDTVLVNIINTPNLPTSPQTDFTYCNGATIGPLQVNPPGTGQFVAWYSDAALTSQVGTGNNFTPPSGLTGVTNYYVTYNLGPCPGNSLMFTITIVNSASIDAGGPFTICPGEAIQLNVTGTTSSVTWSPASSLSDSSVINPIATPISNTVYYIYADISGCSVYDSVEVFISTDPECEFEVYNSFSPDGDGVNETWVIPAVAANPDNKVLIYNRWGDLLAEFTNYDNVNVVWNGTYNGQQLPSGTYYYVIMYPSADRQYAGWIQLMR
jgi:gliding motility-associated-like protein